MSEFDNQGQDQEDTSLQPTGETGIYLHKHEHDWRHVGHQINQLGWWNPVFVCQLCGDVIYDAHVSMPQGPEHKCPASNLVTVGKKARKQGQHDYPTWCIMRKDHLDPHFDGTDARWGNEHDKTKENAS